MDENTRRYYLDTMGIQCWEPLDAPAKPVEQPVDNTHAVTHGSSDREDAPVNYADLQATIQRCTQCALHKTRARALSGRGKPSADLMFVVLSPNPDDEKNGHICSDEAGELLGKMLAAININIDDVYITSLLKCSVPANHTVLPREIQSCDTHLKQQIQFVQPKLIIVLGETAVRCLLQKELSIDQSRAMNESLSQQLASIPLFFSYSPAELLQQPENKRKAWTDLQQLQAIINKLM